MVSQSAGFLFTLQRQKLERSFLRLLSEYPGRIMHSSRQSMSTDKLEIFEETVNTHWDQQHMTKVWGAKCIRQGGTKLIQTEPT